MSAQRNGLLLVLMEAPPALEEEFQAWYETEHVPERENLPGFFTAERYVALSGYPRYMAIYDLDSVDAIHSPEYNAVSGENFSPWTRRVTSRVHATRLVAEQVFPGNAITEPSARLLLVRFRDMADAAETDLVATVSAAFGAWPETRSVRLFVSREQARVDYFAIVALSPPPPALDLAALGDLGAHVDMVNLYARRNLLK